MFTNLRFHWLYIYIFPDNIYLRSNLHILSSICTKVQKYMNKVKNVYFKNELFSHDRLCCYRNKFIWHLMLIPTCKKSSYSISSVTLSDKLPHQTVRRSSSILEKYQNYQQNFLNTSKTNNRTSHYTIRYIDLRKQ